VSVNASSTNERGAVTFTAGPSGGQLVDVTWAGSPIPAAPLAITLTWMSTGTTVASQPLSAVNVGTTKFTIAVPAAPTSGTSYTVCWDCAW
jgi:hypothetical protein